MAAAKCYFDAQIVHRYSECLVKNTQKNLRNLLLKIIYRLAVAEHCNEILSNHMARETTKEFLLFIERHLQALHSCSFTHKRRK